MIKIEFTAATAGELNTLICQYVGQLTVQTGAYTGEVREALQSASDIAVNVDTKKAKKRAEKAPVAAPETAAEVFEEEEEQVVQPPSVKVSAKDLLELKDHTMAALQAAFASGKVNKLRALLEAHGGGAKSFPEVAAEQFPAISEAIKHGALNDA